MSPLNYAAAWLLCLGTAAAVVIESQQLRLDFADATFALNSVRHKTSSPANFEFLRSPAKVWWNATFVTAANPVRAV